MMRGVILGWMGLAFGFLFSAEDVAMAKMHEKQQLKNEDAMMAAHLVQEGFQVIPPRM